MKNQVGIGAVGLTDVLQVVGAGSAKTTIQAGLAPRPAPAVTVTSPIVKVDEPASTQLVAERYFYDPINAGSYPPKPALTKTIDGLHGSQVARFAPSASAIATAIEQTGPGKDARAVDMSFRHNAALPLELFDNPETEVIPPEKRISQTATDQPGVLARSRFYDSRGQFAWAPCYVLAYDRCHQRLCWPCSSH